MFDCQLPLTTPGLPTHRSQAGAFHRASAQLLGKLLVWVWVIDRGTRVKPRCDYSGGQPVIMLEDHSANRSLDRRAIWLIFEVVRSLHHDHKMPQWCKAARGSRGGSPASSPSFSSKAAKRKTATLPYVVPCRRERRSRLG